MTTKRTPIRRDARARLTPEIVALWVRLQEILAAGDDEEWEPKGRRRECLDTSLAIDRALGVKPWESSPAYVDGPEAPPYMQLYAFKVEAWRRAWEWRQVLEAASS